MKSLKQLLMAATLAILAGCAGDNTRSNVDSPGGEKTTKDRALNTGANLLQAKPPLRKFDTYLNGFHFYNGNIDAQMEAHHYVSQLNEDIYQAVIFDGNDDQAKIMGVEYIITEKLFKQLPREEKLLWHSHHHEVKSGTLVAPGIPEPAEHELMEKLVSTYGKTIHTWHTDQQLTLPLGSPMIMMSFTRDGQLSQKLVTERDDRLNVSTSEKRKQREDIPMPVVDSIANGWENGQLRQLTVTDKAGSAPHKH